MSSLRRDYGLDIVLFVPSCLRVASIMSFPVTISVCNPTSDYLRHEYIEVDLAHLKVPDSTSDNALRLYRVWDGGNREVEVAFQIDYPFGQDEFPPAKPVRGRRVMTFESRDTPPGGGEDYRKATATFRLEQDTTGRPALTGEPALKVEHFYRVENFPDRMSLDWEEDSPVRGVKLRNGNNDSEGLEIYFSLVPRPDDKSEINYSGAVTSLRHHRLCHSRGCINMLSPWEFETKKFARWGQLTRLDFYTLPWEPRHYHKEHLLNKNGKERSYSLVWSRAGPCRATVTLASEPFTLRYTTDPAAYGTDPAANSTDPAAPKPNLPLTCRLFRVISVYPRRECYSEQLIVRAEEYPGVSLAFRAHYQSYVDPGALRPQLHRLEEIPDYFAAWWRWANFGRPYPLNLGYAFASDSHVRSLKANSPEINWRLQLGHEHRTVHCFLYEPHQGFGPLHTVGHDAWYQQLFKRLEVIPLNRYLR